MFNYNKQEIVALARENGFRKETLEKVLRLIDVLQFINTNKDLSSFLVLKGGTAINFTVFNLPRLSVDIDLDFSFDGSKEEMLLKRKKITSILKNYMEINNYYLDDDTKCKYALDSFVFYYNNSFGNRDNLKIEINYMNRVHIYEPIIKSVSIDFLNEFKVLTLNNYELYGSKIKALLERCTIRDLYDVFYMIKENIFTCDEFSKIKLCVIFYMAIGQTTNRNFIEIIDDFKVKIDLYSKNHIPQYLSSTLRKDDTFNMNEVVKIVKKFIIELMVLSDNEKQFLDNFDEGVFEPSLIFEDQEILCRIMDHPMALWKVSNKVG